MSKEIHRGTAADRASDCHRRMLLEEGNRAYAALHRNPKDWAEELEERVIWENTLADGLEDDA